MNESSLRKTFSDLRAGGLRYFDSIGSTNDAALAWAADGARDFSIVVADEQTSGRGRLDRKWLTPAGSAIAASLILRPEDAFRPYLSRAAGLAALAIVESFRGLDLDARIKWPNDVLVNGKKVAGILIENTWIGEKVDALVVGMGINVRRAAVPPANVLNFPAASIESELGKPPPARGEILRGLLESLIEFRPRIGSDEFIKAWEDRLAFRGRQVQISAGGAASVAGELLGLDADGGLRLKDAHGKLVSIHAGDVSLREAA